MTPRTKPIPQRNQIQDTVRLSAEGIAKILGDLEARVMHAVWDLGEPVPARTVHDHVYPDHPVALHTVITVLNKLVRKGLLTRQKQSDLLHYQPTVTELEFRTRESRRVVEGILPFSEGAITASLVDILAERDPKHLTRLLEMIELRLREERN